MGLDVVDLVLAVEEEFDLPIPAEDFWMFRTVGDLADYVARLRPRGGVCAHLPAFVRARRALMDVCSIPRAAVHPRTGLADLFPLRIRRQLWSDLNRRIGCPLPDLTHTAEMRRTFGWSLAGLFLCLVASPFACLLLDVGSPRLMGLTCAAAVLSPFILCLIGVVCSRWSDPLRLEFAWHNATVSDLTRYVARRTLPPNRSGHADALAANDVFDRLRLIVSERLSVPIDELERHSRFIEDLGAG
jgi:acyl carrier protein